MTDLLDTGPLPEVDEPAVREDVRGSARVSMTPGDVWRKARLPLAIGGILVAVAVLQTFDAGHIDANYLDPSSEGKPGTRALAEVLRDRGVDVREVRAPSGRRDVTVVIPAPLVDPATVSEARNAAHVVLVEPSQEHAQVLVPDVAVGDPRMPSVEEPDCAHPDALAAGKALAGGTRFRAPADASVCYRRSFVQVERDGRRVTLLGHAGFMTNGELDEEGNAALAMRLLSSQPVVEWVYPSAPFLPPGEEGQSLEDLMPPWVGVMVAQAFVAALLLALWRARRLGPVVAEPLPVVVRAAETVEGRARLYHAARARGRAAEALRAGLRDRLVRALGFGPDASRALLVDAVTVRTRGRSAADVDELLYGPPPPDDPSLVRLADELDSLYSEVRAL